MKKIFNREEQKERQRTRKLLSNIILRAFSLIFVLFVIEFPLANAVSAQTSTGSIVGNVADQTGAVVAGAAVTAKNKATGIEKTVTASQNGEYEIAPLQPGEYEIAVEAVGFAKSVLQAVAVNVGSRATINFSLKPVGIEETAVVSGEAGAIIETTNTVVQGVIDNNQVANLPLASRTFTNLAILVPGAKPVAPFAMNQGRTGTVSIAGSTGRDANISVDGGDNKNSIDGGGLQNYTTEGIQEFVVQTQNYLPDTGRSAGGVVTVATKSGTNELHGSFVLFERNDRFNKRAYNNTEFDKITGDGPFKKQPFDRQNMAGSLGFPIIKNKFFFFGAAEYARENVSVAIAPLAVRELKALDIFAHAGQIPGVSSVAALPNIPTPYRDTQFQVRTDLKWSDKQLIAFRYGHQTNKLENAFITNLADITQSAASTNELRSFLINDAYTFNSKVVNVFTFQFSKYINRVSANSDVVTLEFPNAAFGHNDSAPQSELQNKFQFKDSVSIIKGRHSLKFGIDYVFTPVIAGSFDFFSAPTFMFNAAPSQILAQGLSLNSVDKDGKVIFVDQVLLADGNSRIDQRADQLSVFGQDSFRINRRLTLNYGIRYDADFGVYDPKNGSQAANRAIIALQKIGSLPMDKTALPSDDANNVSPRVGIAFDLRGNGKAVLRASYGIFFDQIFQNVQFLGLQQAQPSIYVQKFFDPIRIGIDPLPQRTGFVTELPQFGVGRAIDPRITTPYSQHASINFQYEFEPGYIFTAQYIHILGLHEFRTLEFNPKIGPIDPNFTFGKFEPRLLNSRFVSAGIGPYNSFRFAASIGRSRYDGFTVGINKRYSGKGSFNYQYGIHYTLSRTLAYGNGIGAARNDFGFLFENPFDTFRPIDMGRTGEDARHRVVFNGILDMPLGLQVSTIVQGESARPFAVFTNQDLNGDGQFNDFARVDDQGNFIRFKSGDKVTGRPLGINPGSGIPYFQVDLRVTKKFIFKDRIKTEGYVEFFNLFDRANIGNNFAGSVLTSIATGKNTPPRFPANIKDLPPIGLLGDTFGPGITIGAPFQAQFGFRVSF